MLLFLLENHLFYVIKKELLSFLNFLVYATTSYVSLARDDNDHLFSLTVMKVLLTVRGFFR